jgi:uncharacterized protein
MKPTPALPFVLGLLLAVSASVHAQTPRQIQWQDLAPKVATSDDPFAKLSRDQLVMLSDVAATRERKAMGDKAISADDLAREQAGTKRLQQEGLDVDALLAKRKELAKQRKAQGETLSAALDGQTVRLPGYVLPLEITGKKVTEFLLVPWVGACIHTPPPPPNQIVHVKADAPFEVTSLFAPVWVTGRLAAGATKRELTLLDGSSDIDVGYTVRASRIEPFKE